MPPCRTAVNVLGPHSIIYALVCWQWWITALTRTSGVARICCEEGQSWKLALAALTADFRAGCSSCLMTNSFVTNAALSCKLLKYAYSRRLDSWLSDLLQRELKMKLLEVEGARAPMLHGWRRHWLELVIGGIRAIRYFWRCCRIQRRRLSELSCGRSCRLGGVYVTCSTCCIVICQHRFVAGRQRKLHVRSART